MTTYYFQLTYSISPRGSSSDSDSKADKARRLIKKIEGWESVNKIETTLVGEISFVSSSDNDENRSEAQSIVNNQIMQLFKDEDVYYDTDSYFSLMVSGLGKHIEFNI